LVEKHPGYPQELMLWTDTQQDWYWYAGEDYRKMYTGKELAGCFANLHMTINNEIRTVKQEIKETNERVGVLESHAALVNDLIKTLNEETVPNLEDKLNAYN
jgi:hypothetical protein